MLRISKPFSLSEIAFRAVSLLANATNCDGSISKTLLNHIIASSKFSKKKLLDPFRLKAITFCSFVVATNVNLSR